MTTLGDVLIEYKELPATGTDPEVLTLTEKNGFVRQADRFHKRLATEDTSKYKVVRRNDIAFNPYLLWAGAVAQNTIIDEGIISPLYPTFRVRDGFDPIYVARLLLTPEVIALYDGIAFGSVPRRRRSSVGDFLNLQIPTPPKLDEQRRIAAILDHADDVRTKRRAQLALLAESTQSMFSAAFGRQTATVRFDTVAGEMRNGLSPSTDGRCEARVLTLSAVTRGTFDPTASKISTFQSEPKLSTRVSSSDFLICRGNGNPALVGIGVHPPKDFPDIVFPDTVIAVRIDNTRIDPRFLEIAWNQRDVRRQIVAVARTTNGTFKVNQQGLGGVEIPLPRLDEQQRFAEQVAALPVLQTSKLDELFASLQSRAFRGEL